MSASRPCRFSSDNQDSRDCSEAFRDRCDRFEPLEPRYAARPGLGPFDLCPRYAELPERCECRNTGSRLLVDSLTCELPSSPGMDSKYDLAG
jgi:hypothetical protein